MEKRDLALSLLVLIVFVSGCVDNGGQSTEQESSGAITVHSLDVQPQEIYGGDSVQVSLDLANTGNLQADINPGEDGENILKNYCRDMFSVEGEDGFQSQPESLSDGGSESLHPDEEAALRWTLQQEGNVPELYDQSCDFELQIPFDYGVSTYRQVQVKRERSVEGTQDLQSESSSGPLLFAVETVGGTGTEGQDTFIAGEDGTMRIHLQLQNTEETDYNKGVIEIDESSLNVNVRRPTSGGSLEFDITSDYCDFDEDNELRMYESQSRVISCEVDVPSSVDRPSTVWEIGANVNYTYLKDAGSETVTVKYDGS